MRIAGSPGRFPRNICQPLADVDPLPVILGMEALDLEALASL